ILSVPSVPILPMLTLPLSIKYSTDRFSLGFLGAITNLCNFARALGTQRLKPHLHFQSDHIDTNDTLI
ncbi:MAG: hypothetical protein ACKO96_07670, partial [Flammeovirgaceae bacterium]